MKKAASGMLALMICCAGAAQAAADVEAVVQANQDAVVVLEGVRADTGAAVQSSGCCVDERGYILTTAHQIAGVEKIQARRADGEAFSVSAVQLEAARELALLKADSPLPAASKIGDAMTLRSGASLISIAAPRSLDFSTVTGIVSNTNRTYNGYPAIQADMRASPGSSGGPVFDRDGRLVGLIIGKLRDEDWITVINPINNAWPLLRVHGIAVPNPDFMASAEQDELIPAKSATEKELRAIQAYNRGVRATAPAAKREAYRLAVTLLPEFFEAWFNLAVSAAAQHKPENAEAAYRKAAALRPDAVAVYRNLGRLCLRMKAPEKALASFREAARLAPDTPQSYNDLGEAWRRLEKADQAVAAFEKALTLDPAYTPARYNLALTAAGAGKPELAVRHFERYLEDAPDAADADQVRQWISQLSKQP
jgi:Tfp pilus assembly protein PilF/uncharacterized protein (DUF779 family)